MIDIFTLEKRLGPWVLVLFCFVFKKASDLFIIRQSLCLELYRYTEAPVKLKIIYFSEEDFLS